MMISQTVPDDSRAINPELWVEQYGDYLFRYAIVRLRNQTAAEEIVQETFLAALQNKQSFASASSEKTWMVGILKHKIMDHYRKTSREKPLNEPDEIESEKNYPFRTSTEWVDHWTEEAAPVRWNPLKAFEQLAFQKSLQHCLEGLPSRISSAFSLREIEELDTDEICKVLEITPTNLWVMLHRARMHLRQCLEMKWFRKEKK